MVGSWSEVVGPVAAVASIVRDSKVIKTLDKSECFCMHRGDFSGE